MTVCEFNILFGLMGIAILLFCFRKKKYEIPQLFVSSPQSIDPISIDENKSKLGLSFLQKPFSSHFLFNSLNTLDAYILKEDKESASRFLHQLSKLLRSIIKGVESDSISLSNELKILRLYFDIESKRYPDRFAYKIAIDPFINQDQVKLPTLLLQQFAECKVWEGLSRKIKPSNISIEVIPEKINGIICIMKECENFATSYENEKFKTCQEDQFSKRIYEYNKAYNKAIKLRHSNLLDECNEIIGTNLYIYIPGEVP